MPEGPPPPVVVNAPVDPNLVRAQVAPAPPSDTGSEHVLGSTKRRELLAGYNDLTRYIADVARQFLMVSLFTGKAYPTLTPWPFDASGAFQTLCADSWQWALLYCQKLPQWDPSVSVLQEVNAPIVRYVRAHVPIRDVSDLAVLRQGRPVSQSVHVPRPRNSAPEVQSSRRAC